MTEDEKILESLKLLRESSAWMVGVETAILGLFITLLTDGKLGLGSWLIKGGVVAFGISLLCAGIVLGAVPWVLTREPPPASVRSAPIANWPLINKISIGWASGIQYLAFVIALACIAAAVILKKFG